MNVMSLVKLAFSGMLSATLFISTAQAQSTVEHSLLGLAQDRETVEAMVHTAHAAVDDGLFNMKSCLEVRRFRDFLIEMNVACKEIDSDCFYVARSEVCPQEVEVEKLICNAAEEGREALIYVCQNRESEECIKARAKVDRDDELCTDAMNATVRCYDRHREEFDRARSQCLVSSPPPATYPGFVNAMECLEYFKYADDRLHRFFPQCFTVGQ